MSWANIAKLNIEKNIVEKVKKIDNVNKDEENINMTNEEYFYLTKGTHIIDQISDFKKEIPPWLLKKSSVYDIYDFFTKFIEMEDIEYETKQIYSDDDDIIEDKFDL